MPDLSALRLQSGPTPPIKLDWPDYVPLPALTLIKNKELVEWDKRNRLRDEMIRENLNEALSKLLQRGN